jgi:hypothetical protein
MRDTSRIITKTKAAPDRGRLFHVAQLEKLLAACGVAFTRLTQIERR